MSNNWLYLKDHTLSFLISIGLNSLANGLGGPVVPPKMPPFLFPAAAAAAAAHFSMASLTSTTSSTSSPPLYKREEADSKSPTADCGSSPGSNSSCASGGGGGVTRSSGESPLKVHSVWSHSMKAKFYLETKFWKCNLLLVSGKFLKNL